MLSTPPVVHPASIEIVVPARNEARRLAIRLLAAGKPVVIGSRALAAAHVEDRHSAVRRTGAAVFRAMARRIVPDAGDTQCGFKFFDGPLVRTAALSLRTVGFAFDIELIASCQRLGAALTEIPVCWRDMPGSSFSVRRQPAAVFRDVASIWLRSRVSQAPAAARPAPPVLPAPAEAAAADALPAGTTTT